MRSWVKKKQPLRHSLVMPGCIHTFDRLDQASRNILPQFCIFYMAGTKVLSYSIPQSILYVPVSVHEQRGCYLAFCIQKSIPLCDMPLSFCADTAKLTTRYFIAWRKKDISNTCARINLSLRAKAIESCQRLKLVTHITSLKQTPNKSS